MIDPREFNPFTGPRRFAERFKDLWDNAVRRDGLAHGPHLLIRELGDGRLWLDALVDERPDGEVDFPLATFRVVSATQDGTNKRWAYTCKLQTKSTAGYDGWADSTADTADYTVYNVLEDGNGSTGTYGNGISQSDLDTINDSGGGTDGTYDLKPIPNEARIEARRVVAADGEVEWWTSVSNAVTGDCPVPA